MGVWVGGWVDWWLGGFSWVSVGGYVYRSSWRMFCCGIWHTATADVAVNKGAFTMYSLENNKQKRTRKQAASSIPQKYTAVVLQQVAPKA